MPGATGLLLGADLVEPMQELVLFDDVGVDLRAVDTRVLDAALPSMRTGIMHVPHILVASTMIDVQAAHTASHTVWPGH